MRLNFATGIFEGHEPTSIRTVQDLRTIWGSEPDPEDHRVVYRTYGPPGHDRTEPVMLFATTVIEPGDVNGECFMTRGHFHVKPERGEWMMIVRGRGALVRRTKEGKAWVEELEAGDNVVIDGAHAHRMANRGDEPLVFIVTWLADCGHDYDTILRQGFGARVTRDGKPLVQ